MRLRWRFVPLAILLLAVVEIAVFVLVAKLIGWLVAFLLLVLLSFAGMVVLAREGRRGWRRVREAARGGGPVGRQAAEGIAGAVGGLLLFIPGFLTGVVGALLLLPPVRRLAAGRVQAMTEKRVPSHVAGDLFGPRQVRVQRTPRPGARSHTQTQTQTQTDEVIEGEIVD